MSSDNYSNKDLAKIGVDYLENAILNVLEGYYKEHQSIHGITPKATATSLDVFRGTEHGENQMTTNDSIISGCLLDLVNHKKVIELKQKRGQYILSSLET